MSEWRGVLKYRGNYYTGAKPRWSPLREEALVFEARELATTSRNALRTRELAKHDVDPRIVIARLRTPAERRCEDHDRRAADDNAQREAKSAAVAAERERIATWLETWDRLNSRMLALPAFTAGNPHKKSFTEGMVFVLKQASARIREGRFHTQWDYPL